VLSVKAAEAWPRRSLTTLMGTDRLARVGCLEQAIAEQRQAVEHLSFHLVRCVDEPVKEPGVRVTFEGESPRVS